MTVSNVLSSPARSRASRMRNCACSLLFSLPDRKRGGVYPEHFVSFFRKEEGVLPRAAPDIQDGAGDLSRGEISERPPGPADIPGRPVPVDRIEYIHTYRGSGGDLTGSISHPFSAAPKNAGHPVTQRLHRIVAARATRGASGATLLRRNCRRSSHFAAGTTGGGTHARTFRHRNASTPAGPSAPDRKSVV